jgi:hypothetical protein
MSGPSANKKFPGIAGVDKEPYNKAMKKLSDIYRKPFFACIFCVIYSAFLLGLSLFGKWSFYTEDQIYQE